MHDDNFNDGITLGVATVNPTDIDETNTIPNTCSDCEHYGVCKYEDKLRVLYSSISDKVSGHKFVDDVIIKCKYHKVNSSISEIAIPNPVDMYMRSRAIDVDGNCSVDISAIVGHDTINKKYESNDSNTTDYHPIPQMYPKFNTSSTYNKPLDVVGMSKDDVVTATNIHLANNKARDLGTIGVTDSMGEHKSIATKVLSSCKKVTEINPAEPVVIGVTEPIGTVMDTTNVPIQTINPDDIPESFRHIVEDNTIREEVPGQTSNV